MSPEWRASWWMAKLRLPHMRQAKMKTIAPEALDPGDRNAQWRSPTCADFDLSRPRPTWDMPPRDAPYLDPDTGQVRMPRHVRLSSRRDYLTGWSALNLSDPEWPFGGDWHRAGWWGLYDAERPWVNCAHMSADRGRHSTAEVLGEMRLYDARESLAHVRHPASRRPTPVWCAHHDRAIADAAWDFVMGAFERGYLKCLHAPTVAEWLWDESQMEKLKKLLEQLTPHVPASARLGWDLWRSELSIDADWTTFRSPAQSMGLV